ncbi:RING finger protein 145-like [Mytilus galloprovincialis]|uniref:RING finger protein 145-like n=1 Tax=Mytilus galloprovincialis TaxID=29158 RepID=UPI003F7C01EA
MIGKMRDHGSTIVGTLQRLPLLFLMDALLSMYATQMISTSVLYMYLAIAVFLLLLTKEQLGKIYKSLVCFLFIISMWPASSENHIWNTLTRLTAKYQTFLTMTKESPQILLYYLLGMAFLSIATCLKMMSLISKLCVYFPRRLAIIGICLKVVYILGDTMTGVFAPEFLNHVWVSLYHVALIILTYHLFNINMSIYLILLQIYYRIYWPNTQYFVINLIIFSVMGKIDKERVLCLLKNRITEIQQDYVSIMKNRIVYVLLPYAIVLTISIPILLYSNNIIQAGTIFMTTITIMCTTNIGTVAFITIITHFCFIFPKITIWFLRGRKYGINTSELLTPAFVLGILAIQSFHSDVKSHGMMMCFGIFLVASTVLEEVHKIVDSFLLELGASGGGITKTCKAVTIIIALIICPIWVVMKFYEIGFDLGIIWFLVATSSWISVCIDSVGSLSVYLLLVLDSFKSEPIEHLDEIMYGIRAAIGIVHIGFGLLQICFLTWNITTIQWSWFSCIILAILVYTTYERVTNGWNEFQRRRTAVHRLSFLPNATQEQLLVFNDVCAICLRDMTSAKITPCNHFFHESCLKKWSYIKETCPMCNAIINTD